MKITFIVYDFNPTTDNSTIQISRINTTLKETEPVRYFGPVIWNNIPIEMKIIKNFNTFKTEIRKWKSTNFWCKLCQTYIKNLGFMSISQ